MQTFETLAEYPLDEDVLAQLRVVVDELETLRLDERGYSVPGDFGDRYTWSYNCSRTSSSWLMSRGRSRRSSFVAQRSTSSFVSIPLSNTRSNGNTCLATCNSSAIRERRSG